ncbi:ABC transporter permease [Alkaliphilus crotonatoxidans]
MLKLMLLEWKRNRLQTYLMASGIITLVLLGFIYLFAIMPNMTMLENEPDLKILTSYDTIVAFVSSLAMVCFAVLSAVMYGRMVITEYTGNRVYLLFSYPIGRKKLFFAKCIVVFLFTTVVALVSSLLVFGIFSGTESIFSIVEDMLTKQIIIKMLNMTVITALTSGGLGLIAMGIGFAKKSLPATILSAVILSAILGNILSNILMEGSVTVSLGAMVLAIVAGGLAVILSTNNVNRMEV